MEIEASFGLSFYNYIVCVVIPLSKLFMCKLRFLYYALFSCRKSLKSLFFLLPLLGVTNALHYMWPNPLKGLTTNGKIFIFYGFLIGHSYKVASQ